MKKFISNALKMLFNKVTFFTILFQWILIAIALLQRGYWEWNGHFVSDRPLYQLVVLLNLPAVTAAVGFISPTNFNSEAGTLKDGIIFIVTITIQWWIIGCAIWQIFGNNKNDGIIDK